VPIPAENCEFFKKDVEVLTCMEKLRNAYTIFLQVRQRWETYGWIGGKYRRERDT
jgi:hypothetical protein